MFMFITYPWPVAAAHVELTGPHPLGATTQFHTTEHVGQRVQDLNDLMRWTDQERLRIQWYRFRLAIRDINRSSIVRRALRG